MTRRSQEAESITMAALCAGHPHVLAWGEEGRCFLCGRETRMPTAEELAALTTSGYDALWVAIMLTRQRLLQEDRMLLDQLVRLA